MNRSATLSTTGRSFTTGDNRTLLTQKPSASFVISKPGSNDSKSTASKLNKLTKVGSKKVTLQTSTTLRYDESFMRYVNGFDLYFKASELRNNQSSSGETQSKSELSRSRVRYATEESTSAEATSSCSVSDTRSFSLDSPRSPKKRSLPRVSLVYDTAPHIDLLDSPKSFSETASSYYATPDQDRSFITTPSDNCSFFATASEQSSYLTAGHESLDDSYTFVHDAKQFSSQETLYNEEDDEDIFKDDGGVVNDDDDDEDDDDEDVDERRDRLAELAGPSSSGGMTAAFSRLYLGRLEDKAATAGALTSPEREKFKLGAKVRRSNFVRSTCIDLEEDDGAKGDERPPANSSPVADEDEGKSGNSTSDLPMKCSPT